jgi:enolase
MPTISNLHAREILDSRGIPTLEVTILAGDITARASVPSGKSKGKHEALELRDNEPRYFGMGVNRAIEYACGLVAHSVNEMPLGRQDEFDKRLKEIDGTQNFEKIGANTAIGASMAYARASAASAKKELWEYIAEIFGEKHARLPKLYMNVINGGEHAGNDLAIQEFHIIPVASRLSDAVEIGAVLYGALRSLVAEKYGKSAVNVGDEGGFAIPSAKTTGEVFALILEAGRRCGSLRDFRLGIDAAASSFYKEGKYAIDGLLLAPGEMIGYYENLVKSFELEAIEDPFAEEDFDSFAELKKRLVATNIIGDDLTVTNTLRIMQAAEKNAVGGVIIKPNQVGTVTDALEASKLARTHGWKLVASHRSGDTEDSFIADFAVGIGADAVKFGAPARGERTAKYNRLKKIFERT